MSDLPPQYRAQLLAYIDLTLSAEQLDQFEQQMIGDEEFSSSIALAEQELLEAYAASTLTPNERRIVEPWVLESPRRIEHVQLTRSLAERQRIKTPSTTLSHITAFRSRYLLYISAIAASLLVAVLFITRHKSAMPSSSPSSLQQVASVPHAAPATADMILLTPERTRGRSTTKTNVYTLHPNSETRLQLVIPASSNAAEYTLTLQNDTTKTTTSHPHLPRLETSGLAYVEVSLSPGAVSPGAYIATLRSPTGPLVARFNVTR